MRSRAGATRTAPLTRRVTLPPFPARPLERARAADLQRVPLGSKLVELPLQVRIERSRVPALVELPGELLRTPALRQPRPADPFLPLRLWDQRSVHRHEDPRVAACSEVAEDGAVEAELRLGHEV